MVLLAPQRNRLAIIGSGIAGVTAALTFRRSVEEDFDINIFTEDTVLPYFKPRIIEYITGNAKLSDILINKFFVI